MAVVFQEAKAMTLIRNLAGETVDENTFVCKDCTLEHPLSDLGAFEVTSHGVRAWTDFVCAHCLAPRYDHCQKVVAEKSTDIFSAIMKLRPGETIYFVKAPVVQPA